MLFGSESRPLYSEEISARDKFIHLLVIRTKGKKPNTTTIYS
jgi:hypothetical protein